MAWNLFRIYAFLCQLNFLPASPFAPFARWHNGLQAVRPSRARRLLFLIRSCGQKLRMLPLVTTGKRGLVTQYKTFRGNPSDSGMLSDILTVHHKQYGQSPNNLCGDRRFFSSDSEKLAYKNHVKKVSICKPGYRSKARKQIEKQRWFKKL